MTKYSTPCKKCYFAKESDSDIPCSFYIPDAIKDIKKIEIIDNFNYIHDYACKYGMEHDNAKKIISEYQIDLMEYTKNNVSIKYLLFIFINKKDNLKDVCADIKKLNIKPLKISLAFYYDCDISDAQKNCEEILGKDYAWKLCYFIEKKERYDMLQTSLTTDDRLSKCNHILITDSQILKDISDKDSINKINFIVNVQQPNSGIMSHDSNNNFFGIFTLLKNIHGIYNYIDHDIEKVVKEKYQQNIVYYD